MERDCQNFILLLKKLFAFFPIVLLLIIVNYLVDPAAFFSSFNNFTHEKHAVEILIREKKEGIRSVQHRGDSRLIQKLYIKSLKDYKEVIVFGSSRSWQITSRDLCLNKSFFNHSVAGGKLEDFMAMYNIYCEEKKIKKTIIFELSTEHISDACFIKNINIKYPLREEYQKMLSLLGIDINSDKFVGNVKYEALKELISPKYFQLSLLKLLDKFYFRKNEQVEDLGSVKELNKLSIINSRALSFEKNMKHMPRECFNHQQAHKFELFVKKLLQDGIRIIFFLPPYHPIVYKGLDNKTAYGTFLLEARKFFINFSQKYNIEIAGSINPHIYGIDEADFTDGYHPRETATGKIFKNIVF